MLEPITIDPEETLPPGLDYALLKEEGTALLQQLSGSIWTDYNESDPGVTVLEQLCYALTELSYRAEIPLADLLTRRGSRRIDPNRQALFPARRILPCNPVTADDYRKLLIDRLPEVANAWLTPHRARQPAKRVDGLYDLWLYVPDDGQCKCPPDSHPEIRQRARRVYGHHRGLCEDLRSVRVLQPVRTRVQAVVTIDDSASPEATLARAFFELGLLLAPEPKRLPLDALVDADVPPDQIFEGPLLLNGFIENEQLTPKAAEIPVRDIGAVLAGSPGVTGVRGVEVRVEDAGTFGPRQTIPVPRGNILDLDTSPRRGGFPIRLFSNGVELQPDPARVEAELLRLRDERRRAYPLNPQYREAFAMPEGRYRNVEPYGSIQNQFPAVYGINAFGLPENSSPERQGQAKQLKGYLLVFEQLMADFFAQLSRAKDLYSTDPALARTYFFQYLNRSVPDVAPLLRPPGDGSPGYRLGLPALVRSQDPAVERRGRFLDFLLALFAWELGPTSVAGPACGGRSLDGSDRGLLRAKLALLQQMVPATRDRGRGFDTMDPFSDSNVSGMEIVSRIQLGMGPRPLTEVLDELALTLVDSEGTATMGRPLVRHGDHIEDTFEPVQALEGDDMSAPPSPSGGAVTITEEFLAAAREVDNFRVGTFAGDDAVTAVCRIPGEADWRLVGKFSDRDAAVFGVHGCVRRMRSLDRHLQQLYVVEHNLLRYGRTWAPRPPGDGHPPPPPAPFEYSFTVTAVISTCADPADESGHRAFACRVLRSNAPAHVVVDVCFLRPRRMCDFEHLYWSWRRALRRWSRQRRLEDLRRLTRASGRLRSFLQTCRSRGDDRK
ncbi:MAG: hypothetical protein AAGD06_20630 [Acidobacteriota bacterium]